MLWLRLCLAFIYFTLRPKKRRRSPILVMLLLVSINITAWYLWDYKTTALNKQLIDYSPTLSLEEQKNLAISLYNNQYYDASWQISQLLTTNYTTIEAFWPPEMRRLMFPKKSLRGSQARVKEQLELFPTARDLWIYNGWIALYLRDETEIRKTKEMLSKIDPNNPQAEDWLNQL